jgi:hypothetical protein
MKHSYLLGMPSMLLVEFEVLTAVSTKMAVLWVVTPCSLAEVSEVLAASIIRAMSYLLLVSNRIQAASFDQL